MKTRLVRLAVTFDHHLDRLDRALPHTVEIWLPEEAYFEMTRVDDDGLIQVEEGTEVHLTFEDEPPFTAPILEMTVLDVQESL